MSSPHWQYLRNCLLPETASLPVGISRIGAAVEYSGHGLSGWQRQRHSPSVQAAVEEALSYVADEPIAVVCAGRTDAGVHATNQIIHFDTTAARQSFGWIRGANTRLPKSIRLHWAAPVKDHFHARFSAQARTYRYLICNQASPPAILNGLMTWYKGPLDEQAMHVAAQGLLGENDFSSYRAASCQSRSCRRNVTSVQVSRHGAVVVIEITANAFLHHMVRNIAGVLIAVGSGQQPVSWPRDLLALRDRSRGEITAPPDGLFLVGVDYPAHFSIPAFPSGPQILAGIG